MFTLLDKPEKKRRSREEENMKIIFDTNVWKIRYHEKAYFLTLSISIFH